MVNLANINRWTIGQIPSEELEKALSRTTNKAKRALIQAELDSRKAVGVDRPVTLEDYLG
jgi:hypothetical protein